METIILFSGAPASVCHRSLCLPTSSLISNTPFKTAMKIQHIDQEIRVRFSDHPTPYTLSHSYCTNPDCDCYELSFHFKEISEDNPFHFNLQVDLRSWKELNAPEREEKIDHWVQEFLKELPDKEKRQFYTRYDAKFAAKRLQSVRLRPDDVRSGTLISYADLISERRSIYEGGVACFSIFDHNGTEYAVDPLYCPNPKCHCNESRLLFVRIIHDEQAEITNMEDCMIVQLQFKGGWDIKEHWEILLPEAKRVVAAWLKKHPDVIGELKPQYQAIKAVGRRSLEQERQQKRNLSQLPTVEGKKPGRNAPCPCGSGKKYKKCCGQ